MKKAPLIFLVFMALHARAGFERCPPNWVHHHPDIYQLLTKLTNFHRVGDCQIELRICDSTKETAQDSQLADVLISSKGKEYYFPLYVNQVGGNIYSDLTMGDSIIFYDFLDENTDPSTGKKEKDGLTLIFNLDQTRIDEIRLVKKQDHSKKELQNLPQRLVCRSPERERSLRRRR